MLHQATEYYNSPIGWLEIITSRSQLLQIHFISEPQKPSHPNSLSKQVIRQLHEYFEGTRQEFSLSLAFEGTDFQSKVWKELQNIPYGSTASYKEIAERIHSPHASRAVGNANNKNPLPIVIPCHRVVGSSGKLVGYAGGVDKKQWLLQHESSSQFS